jgi:hypothetical protein
LFIFRRRLAVTTLLLFEDFREGDETGEFESLFAANILLAIQLVLLELLFSGDILPLLVLSRIPPESPLEVGDKSPS